MKSAALFCLFFFAFFSDALAKPSMIRLGYVSCVSCHASPAGGSQLTPYGRGISAGEALIVKELAEEGEEEFRKFSMHHGVQAREIHTIVKEKNDTFLMQADYLNSTTIKNIHRIDTAIGIVPAQVRQRPNAGTGALGKNFILRRLTYNLRASENEEFSFGRDLPMVGLLFEDHTSYLRSASRVGVSDYVTRLRWDYWDESKLWSASIDGPSFEETTGNREWGAHARFEKVLANKFTLGAHALAGETRATKRYGLSAFSRYSFAEMAGVLLEVQYLKRHSRLDLFSPFPQTVYTLHPFVTPIDWLEIQGIFEVLSREEPFLDKTMQYGVLAFARIWNGLSLQIEGRQIKPLNNPAPTTLWIFQGVAFL